MTVQQTETQERLTLKKFENEIKQELDSRKSKIPLAMFMAEAQAGITKALKGKTGKLAGRDLRSVLIEAASHGFIPGRHCHFLAFKTRDGDIELTCVMGYKGVMELVNGKDDCCIYTPKFVRSSDVFNITTQFSGGREETTFTHKPNLTKESDLQGVYCAWRRGEESGVEYRGMAYIKKVQTFAKSKGGAAWTGPFWEEMALKTVVLRAAKYFPLGLPEFSGDAVLEATEPMNTEQPALEPEPKQVAHQPAKPVPGAEDLPPAEAYEEAEVVSQAGSQPVRRRQRATPPAPMPPPPPPPPPPAAKGGVIFDLDD